jgi:hypothetical protein
MKRFFLSIFLVGATVFSNAQTVDEVIAKYVDAMGGKDKLSSIQSLHMVGISTMQNGNEVTTETWKENNKLYRRESNFGMGSMKTLITTEGGWQTNFRSGGAFEAMQEQMLKSQRYEIETTVPLFDYAAKGHKAELLGKETIDGKEAWKIKLTTKDGRELTYFIDATTNYITRLIYKGRSRGPGGGGGEEIDIIVSYANYDKTADGYIFPFSQTMSGGFGGTITYEKIEVNPKIDGKLYKAE